MGNNLQFDESKRAIFNQYKDSQSSVTFQLLKNLMPLTNFNENMELA